MTNLYRWVNFGMICERGGGLQHWPKGYLCVSWLWFKGRECANYLENGGFYIKFNMTMMLKSLFLGYHQSLKSDIAVSLRVDIRKVNAEFPRYLDNSNLISSIKICHSCMNDLQLISSGHSWSPSLNWFDTRNHEYRFLLVRYYLFFL